MNYGNTMAAQAAASYPSAPPPALPVGRFDAPANHLEEMTKGLAEYSQRLVRVADKLSGSIPEAAEKDPGRLTGAGVVARFEGIAETYSQLLRKIGNTLERLESL